MNEFPKFEAGKPALEQLSATKLNMLSDGIRANQILPGVGYRVTQTPAGATVSAIRKRQPAPPPHPWKVSPDGEGTVKIEAGEVLGMHLTYDGYDPDVPPVNEGKLGPDHIVLGPAGSYAGGSGISITGTQYIYAEINRNGPTTEYCESFKHDLRPGTETDTLVELYDDIEPEIGAFASIAISSVVPSSYEPTTGYAAVCIALVTNTAGVITVDKQYVTHNPTLFVPIVGASVSVHLPG